MQPKFLSPRRALIAVLSLMVIAAALSAVAGTGPASAHGSVADPPSRTYVCRFLQPENPACERAWAANSQALYDWMEVNIGDVGGQHQARIPDGQLCSAGRSKYAAFDEATSDWPVTAIEPESDGLFHFSYEATAPHSTEYFRFYLTRDGFDVNQPLRWTDLELVYDSGPTGRQSTYHFDVDLPARTGRHILYQVWQRSDSPEAFYSCSDVTIGPQPEQPPTTAPPTTVPPTTTAPPTTVPEVTTTRPPQTTTTAPPAPGLTALDMKVWADWGRGFCATGTVTNTGAVSTAWTATFDGPGRFTSTWNAAFRRTGGTVDVSGAQWNRVLPPGGQATFGFCAAK